MGPRRFQSTHPRGVRPGGAADHEVGSAVSIHAPAWGATCSVSACSDCVRLVSIHAPAWGATRSRAGCGPFLRGFQSTHPRGVRRSPGTASSAVHGFQSTHPRGVRPDDDLPQDRTGLVSIHAPAWGATAHGWRFSGQGKVSIHAPAWGATAGRLQPFDLVHVSIHAPAWGATKRLPSKLV